MIPHVSGSATTQSNTSRSDSIRELYSSNPTTLLSPAPPYATIDENESFQLSSNYRSDHPLAAVRLSSTFTSSTSSNDRSSHRSHAVGIATTPTSYPTYHPPVRSHLIIDITPGGSISNEKPTRPRSDTFGGVPIPPTAMLPLSSSSRNTTTTTTPSSPSQSHYRTNSSSSLPLHLGGGTFAERKPVLYAGLRAGALFIVCLGVVLIALKIMLPTIEVEDKEFVKLPKSFEELKALNRVLQVRRA